jgi:ferredoxin-type protein NapH
MSTRPLARRQRIRHALLLLSFVAFPVTINYFSPYLSVDSSFQGILNGSVIVFGAMFLGSLVFGRVWCGWACPIAGLTEPLLRVNDRRVPRRAGIAKWVIWVPWVTAIVIGVARAGGYHAVQPLYGTVGGISTAAQPDRPIIFAYLVYFIVVGLFAGLAIGLGRRNGCHTVCWMAPFMILGRTARNALAWPSLRLSADPQKCAHCHTCTSQCPMSIDVESHVAAGAMEDHDCSLCGTCVDGCQKHAILYRFSSGR